MNTLLKTAFTKKLFPDRFYDSYFLTEYGRLESLRAARYSLNFSVVLIRIESTGAGTENAYSEFMKKFASMLIESVRNCDVVGLDDEGRIVAILPATDYFGSLATVRKLNRATGPLVRKAGPLKVTFSSATYPMDGHGYGELIGAAENQARDKAASLREALSIDEKLFWEIVADLFNKNPKTPVSSTFDVGEGHPMPVSLIDRLNEQLVREVTRTPRKKGILYVAPRTESTHNMVTRLLATMGTTATKVFVIGSSEDEGLRAVKNATAVSLDDPRLSETFFTIYLGSDTGYALISRENWGGTFSCFHTSDAYLIEGLITKFQNEYSLQEQLG